MLSRAARGLLGALAFAAGAGAAVAETAPLELVSPAAGATLPGGERVLLEWRSPAGDVDFGEWEAFLSLDGGASYPFRLTPHLDAAHRRVLVEIPPFATGTARFLLRFGHEPEEAEREDGREAEREESVLVPGLWRIAAPASSAVSTPRRWARAPGEPARPGDAGVAFWVEGDRDGRRRTSWQAATAGLSGPDPGALTASEHALACSEPESRPAPHALPERGADATGSEGAPLARAALSRSPPSTDRLALHVRRNE